MVSESKNVLEVKAVGMAREKREHVRVDDMLKVDYRKISQKDYSQCKGKQEIIFKNIFGKPFEAPQIEDVSLELLYKLIYQANLKIDRILDILESKDAEKYASMNV
jgi:hypothetical protein